MSGVEWFEGDMRSFDFDREFALAMVPGHAFMNLESPAEQLACLESIRRHLVAGGRLVLHVDHQNLRWLSNLPSEAGTRFEMEGEVISPATGRPVRISNSWAYELATQNASLITVWEEIGPDGSGVERWERGPRRFHCLFRYETQHLLERSGFEIEAVYGSFDRSKLSGDSPEMIWLARRPC